jgi:DNA gyrase subunit A
VGSIVVPVNSKDISLFVIAENGYGKKTKVDEYKTQNRSGSGILTYKVTDKTGPIIVARALYKGQDADILIASQSGKILRLSSDQIPTLGRATQGVRLIKLDAKDKVTSAAVIENMPEQEADA